MQLLSPDESTRYFRQIIIPGILGPLPGLVASIQTLEAVKLILGMDGLLKCRLLHIQGSDMTFKMIEVERNKDCEVCNP